jgi:hypothetical protein
MTSAISKVRRPSMLIPIPRAFVRSDARPWYRHAVVLQPRVEFVGVNDAQDSIRVIAAELH